MSPGHQYLASVYLAIKTLLGHAPDEQHHKAGVECPCVLNVCSVTEHGVAVQVCTTIFTLMHDAPDELALCTMRSFHSGYHWCDIDTIWASVRRLLVQAERGDAVAHKAVGVGHIDAFLGHLVATWTKKRTPEDLLGGIKAQCCSMNDLVYIQPGDVKVKMGRNKPCSCGSSKKYKKCCGSNVQH